MALREPVDAVVQHAAQLHHRGHGLARAGDLPLHLVNEVLHPGRHGDIEAVRVGGDGREGFVCGHPLDVELVSAVEQLSHRAEGAALLAVSHLAQLVKGRLKLVLAALEACGTAAGEIVLFQHQDLLAFRGKIAGGGQTAVSGADDHYVILGHGFIPPFLYQKLMHVFVVVPQL